jgi:hypothetical protein
MTTEISGGVEAAEGLAIETTSLSGIEMRLSRSSQTGVFFRKSIFLV